MNYIHRIICTLLSLSYKAYIIVISLRTFGITTNSDNENISYNDDDDDDDDDDAAAAAAADDDDGDDDYDGNYKTTKNDDSNNRIESSNTFIAKIASVERLQLAMRNISVLIMKCRNFAPFYQIDPNSSIKVSIHSTKSIRPWWRHYMEAPCACVNVMSGLEVFLYGNLNTRWTNSRVAGDLRHHHANVTPL